MTTPHVTETAITKEGCHVMPATTPPRSVIVNNGGTYEGRTVQVVRVERDGSLIVTHPNGSNNMLRLKPAREINGNAIEAQFRAVSS